MSAADTASRSYAEASKTLLRDLVLDALADLLSDRVWADVSMSDVAKHAGVSRQTLYNAFGDRAGLAQAYVLREADRFLAAVTGEIRTREDDPRAAVSAALEIFLAAVATHPLVRAISAAEEGDELLALVTIRGAPVRDRVIEGLSAIIAETWPGVPRADTELVADCLVRLAISHAALPAGEPEETAAAIARVLSPYLDELLAKVS